MSNLILYYIGTVQVKK